jgi:acyl dehydratase
VPVAPVTRIMATTVGGEAARVLGDSGTFGGPVPPGGALTVEG